MKKKTRYHREPMRPTPDRLRAWRRARAAHQRPRCARCQLTGDEMAHVFERVWGSVLRLDDGNYVDLWRCRQCGYEIGISKAMAEIYDGKY